jgi:predicted ATPase
MQLYAWSGQRAAALRQYQELERLLENELGVPPLEGSTELYEAIKAHQHPSPPEPAPRPTLLRRAKLAQAPPMEQAGAVGAYPLVGRASEWATLLRAYATAGASGHLLVLEGEAGIGKTRLAEEFLAHARAGGATTVAARCYEGEANLAFGPFVEALRSAIAVPGSADRLGDLAPHWLSEAVRLLPELASPWSELPSAPPLESPGAQSRFFEGLRQTLLALCTGAPPGILFLDDLHWADASSLELLTYLVRRLRGQPLCLLVTWRSEQVPAGHPLRIVVAESQRVGAATTLVLSRLSRSAVQELVESVPGTGRGWPEDLGERLYQESEGLPFFVVEYLATGIEVVEGRAWSLPGSVRDLLESRLAGTSETGRQVLGAAAVIGRSCDYDTLRTVSGRSDEETVAALEGLMTQGLIQEVSAEGGERGPVYDFGHDKLREVVYDGTSLARRRLLHRRAAEALVDQARGLRENGALAGQIARHFRLAGLAAAAAEYSRLAGEHARTLYANAEALAHLREALALGHPDLAGLHEAVGDLQTLSGQYGAALTSYEAAAALAEPGAQGTLEHKVGNVYQRRGEWDRAERHYETALAVLGEASQARETARLFADWSLTAHRRGQPGRASDLARQALALASTAGDRRALAQAHNMLGILATSQGDPDTARHHLEHSLELAANLNDPSAQVAALNNLALAWAADGETGRALELAERALALCSSQGDRHREAALHNNLADLLHRDGQADAAMAHLKQAAAIFAEIGHVAGTWQPEIWKLVEW